MKINTTKHYHLYDLQTLGWELTVCNALAPAQSPCRSILRQNDSYGHLLYSFLDRILGMGNMKHVLEVGGGYGNLMKDLLQKDPTLKVTMLDISPYLLARQTELLKGYDICFRQEDFLDTEMSSLKRVDMAILNENIGDFPTVLDIHTDMFNQTHERTGHDPLAEVRRCILRYGLAAAVKHPFFHFNLGAVKALEKLCSAGISAIFISEHSCEAKVPEPFKNLIKISSPGFPERIALRGHDEYTIQFSQLEKIAAHFSYNVIRGPLANIIPIEITDRLRCTLTAPAARTDEDEIIRHFTEDLFKYEYLLLTKLKNAAQYEALFDPPSPPHSLREPGIRLTI